jgi:hypothetical protein
LGMALFITGIILNGVWTQGFMPAKQVLLHLSHILSPFCSGYFRAGVWWTICLGWPQIILLLISASQVARLTGMSYWCLDCNFYVRKVIWDKDLWIKVNVRISKNS